MANNVVVHFLDGRVVKGTSMDVDPEHPTCHLVTQGQPATKVKLADMKALFFVKTFQGDPKRNDRTEPDPEDPRLKGAKRVEARFKDGERISGLSNRFPPRGSFFFMLPIDPASNNIRVLVNRSALAALTEVK